MSKRYPKSRLPGPAVRLFDRDMAVDPDQTVRQGAHEAVTVSAPPEVEWILADECRQVV